MHKLTLKKLVRPSSYGTRFSSADVYIDDNMIGSAYNYGSPDEITFYPNTHGDAYLANFISISKLFELIKAVAADKAVHAEIAEIAETKVIFINAKDNTMSYIRPDAYENIRKKLIFYGYKNNHLSGDWKYDMCYCDTECFHENDDSLSLEVDGDGPHRAINEVDFGFSSLYQFDFPPYDFYELFLGHEVYYLNDEKANDGSYWDLVNETKPTPFIGNAIIKTNKFTLEQLSQFIKCFVIQDNGSGPVIVEHDSNPKIISLDDFLI